MGEIFGGGFHLMRPDWIVLTIRLDSTFHKHAIPTANDSSGSLVLWGRFYPAGPGRFKKGEPFTMEMPLQYPGVKV